MLPNGNSPVVLGYNFNNISIEYFSIRKHTRKSIAPEDSTSDADNTLNINSSPGLFEISQVSAADFHISS